MDQEEPNMIIANSLISALLNLLPAAQTNASLRDQFDTLVRSKNLDYRLEYITRLTVNGKSIESTACESAEKAERQILLTAIKELRDMQSAPVVDETMNEEVIESEIVQEIKQVGLSGHESC